MVLVIVGLEIINLVLDIALGILRTFNVSQTHSGRPECTCKLGRIVLVFVFNCDFDFI